MQTPSKIFRDEFFGASYKLGGRSKLDGFDCFTFIYCFHEKRGFDMPNGINGITVDNYIDFWNKDKKSTKESMWSYINSFTEPVQITLMEPGDIVVIKDAQDEMYPGIFVGNGLIASVFADLGMQVCRLDSFSIIGVRRWVGNG